MPVRWSGEFYSTSVQQIKTHFSAQIPRGPSSEGIGIHASLGESQAPPLHRTSRLPVKNFIEGDLLIICHSAISNYQCTNSEVEE